MVFQSLQCLWSSRCSTVAMVFQSLQWLYGLTDALQWLWSSLPESAVAVTFQSLQWLWSSSVYSGYGLPESGGQCSSRVCSVNGLPESAEAIVFHSRQWLWSSSVCSGYGLPESAVALIFQSLVGNCLPESAVAMVLTSSVCSDYGLPDAPQKAASYSSGDFVKAVVLKSLCAVFRNFLVSSVVIWRLCWRLSSSGISAEALVYRKLCRS
jgi:hypothetical protein